MAKKTIIYLFLSLIIVHTVFGSFKKGPYLIYQGTNTKMDILWQTDNTNHSIIEWGKNNSYGNIITLSTTPDYFYHITLTNLTPGTKYDYRITHNGDQFVSSFYSAPKNTAKKVTFYAYGDTRTNPSTHNNLAGQILQDMEENPQNRQSIIIFSGDFNTKGTEKDWQNQWFNRDFSNLVKLYGLVPYMTCRGNHEDGGSYPNDSYRKYYPHAPDRDYYSFDYGPVHFTVIQQFGNIWSDIQKTDITQYTWISNDLAQSHKPFKFVLFHAPAWSAGGHKDDEFVGMQTICKKLFVPLGVSAVINGHNHYYSRCTVDGIEHLTLGGGGAPLYKPNPNNNSYIQKTAHVHHYARFDINGNYCFVTIFDTDHKEIIETFYIKQHK